MKGQSNGSGKLIREKWPAAGLLASTQQGRGRGEGQEEGAALVRAAGPADKHRRGVTGQEAEVRIWLTRLAAALDRAPSKGRLQRCQATRLLQITQYHWLGAGGEGERDAPLCGLQQERSSEVTAFP